MASLKEVKNRISSVKNTRKITSAMKMVASSKLHHARQAIERMRPYETRLKGIMAAFVGNLEEDIHSPYAEKREVKKVAIVVISSNSGLCGGFNGNVIKQLRKTVDHYREVGTEIVRIVPIGRKATEATSKLGFSTDAEASALLDHPRYEGCVNVAENLMQMYEAGEVDKVELIYHHYKSASTQELLHEEYLPVNLTTEGGTEASQALDYIVEPSVTELLTELVPKALHLQLFTALLDSLASEHAARVIAMQVATDNADELLADLTLMYNKTRQQAITAELLDIVGGSLQ